MFDEDALDDNQENMNVMDNALREMSINSNPKPNKRAKKSNRYSHLQRASKQAVLVNSGKLPSKAEAMRLKKSLNNRKGRVRTESENKLIIQFILYQIESETHVNLTDTITNAVSAFGGSYTTYLELWNRFWRTKQDLKPNKETRGRPCKVIDAIEKIDSECNGNLVRLLAQFVFDKTIKNNTGFTRPVFMIYLRENDIEKESHVQSLKV